MSTPFPNYVSGLPAVTALNPGDLVPVVQSGVARQASKALMEGLILRTARLDLYVDSVAGNDINDGLSPGTAFRTIKHCNSIAALYDYNGFNMSITLADNTSYSEGSINWPLLTNTGFAFVSSNSSDPTKVTITSNTDTCLLQNPTPYQFEGITFISTNGSAFAATGSQTKPLFDICNWSANADGCIFLADRAQVEIFNQHHILSGNTSVAFTRSLNGVMVYNNPTITIDAAWSPSHGFVEVSQYGITTWNGVTINNPGNVTGPKFSIGFGAAFGGDTVLQNLPGTLAGSNAAPGCSVQTGTANVATIVNGRDFPTVASTPTTGTTVTTYSGQKGARLTPAGALAALTVNLPINMFDAEVFRLYSTQTITALTMATTDGSSMVGMPTTLAAGAHVEFVYSASNTTWYAN